MGFESQKFENEMSIEKSKAEDEQIKSIEKTEGLKEKIPVEDRVLEIEKENEEIGRQMEELNKQALEIGTKKWGIAACEWTDDLKRQWDFLSVERVRNIRLLNEINSKLFEVKKIGNNEESQTLREKFKLDDAKKFENNFRRELKESTDKLLDRFRTNIFENNRVKIKQQGFKEEKKYYISHLDFDKGLLYVSERKIGKSSIVIGGIDVRTIENIETE